MRKLIYLLLVTGLLSSQAQDKKKYNAALKSAIHVHDTASKYQSSAVAVDILKAAAKEFENEWLANYWAAYIYTQMGLYKDRPEDAGQVLMTGAKEQIEKAKTRYNGEEPNILSDLHALQSFVYQVHSWYPEYQEEKEKYIEMAKEESRKALALNPDNPLIYVLMGTDKLRSEKLSDVVAGRALLYQANSLFKQVNEHRAMTTQWNEEWLRFYWLKYSDRRLAELTKS